MRTHSWDSFRHGYPFLVPIIIRLSLLTTPVFFLNYCFRIEIEKPLHRLRKGGKETKKYVLWPGIFLGRTVRLFGYSNLRCPKDVELKVGSTIEIRNGIDLWRRDVERCGLRSNTRTCYKKALVEGTYDFFFYRNLHITLILLQKFLVRQQWFYITVYI